MKTKTTALTIQEAVSKGYFPFAGRGDCWNNSVHISKNGQFLCGHAGLSSNHYRLGEKTFKGKTPTLVCKECAKVYHETN